MINRLIKISFLQIFLLLLSFGIVYIVASEVSASHSIIEPINDITKEFNEGNALYYAFFFLIIFILNVLNSYIMLEKRYLDEN